MIPQHADLLARISSQKSSVPGTGSARHSSERRKPEYSMIVYGSTADKTVSYHYVGGMRVIWGHYISGKVASTPVFRRDETETSQSVSITSTHIASNYRPGSFKVHLSKMTYLQACEWCFCKSVLSGTRGGQKLLLVLLMAPCCCQCTAAACCCSTGEAHACELPYHVHLP